MNFIEFQMFSNAVLMVVLFTSLFIKVGVEEDWSDTLFSIVFGIYIVSVLFFAGSVLFLIF